MMVFDAQGARRDGVPPEMIRFMEWATTQDEAVVARVVASVEVIAEVMEGRVVVETPYGPVPNVWAKEQAASILRDIAQAAGFADAARVCEEMRQEALQASATLEQAFGFSVVCRMSFSEL